MPNITIYLKDELYNKLSNSNKELQKEARLNAVKAIEKTLRR